MVRVTTDDAKVPPQPSVLRNSHRDLHFSVWGLTVLSAAQHEMLGERRGQQLCAHKHYVMPLGHLHIQWLLLNVQVRMGELEWLMLCMSFHISHRAIGGGSCIPWTFAPAALKRWIWCNNKIFNLYVKNCLYYVQRPHPPIVPGPRKRILIKHGME